MTWTVNRRIAVGFATVLGLTALVTLLGWMTQRSVETAYRGALLQERDVVVPGVEAEGANREANVEFLRFLLTGDERFARSRDSSTVVSRTLLTRLRDAATVAEDHAGWEEALGLQEAWDREAQRATERFLAGDRAAAVQQWETTILPLRLRLLASIEQNVARFRARSEATLAGAEAAAARMRLTLLGGGLLAVLLGIGTAVRLSRAVTGPLRETTGVLASSAAEILAATTQQASGAAETSAAVVETSTTVDEVTQTADQSTERARSVAASVQRTAEIGQRGRLAVEGSVAAMEGVREQVESIADSILTLAEQAQSIGEIIATVNTLAERTNLLALNAAVEAARAGEHGRGFAVVAGEVRSLADQSMKATVQVRQILGEIQRATGAAVMTTERGTQQVAAGAVKVQEAGETIRALTESATEAAHAAAQIVASAGQQAAGLEQIRYAMVSIQDATQQTVASTRETEQAAQELNRLGDRLLDLVGRADGARDGRSARA